MTIAIILNAVFVVLLLTLLAATMRLPFHLRSGEEVQARAKRQRVRQPRPVRADRPALRAGRGQLASD
jgi:NhaP-type Na+/H+ or K+/H+ antiporter